jgi:hypothetical protein
MQTAGYKAVSANTMPTETTVDRLRSIAYSKIRHIIGTSADNTDTDAKNAEIELVLQGIAAIKAGQVPMIIMPPDMELLLQSKFSIQNIILPFEPGQDETN